jgi:hypothetical protein
MLVFPRNTRRADPVAFDVGTGRVDPHQVPRLADAREDHDLIRP